MKHRHQPKARHCQSWATAGSNRAPVLTLEGKGCRTTPLSGRDGSALWEYCLGDEPVSYMDMARPPRAEWRPKGPWGCCCPLGACQRRVVFSVCRELSCARKKHALVKALAKGWSHRNKKSTRGTETRLQLFFLNKNKIYFEINTEVQPHENFPLCWLPLFRENPLCDWNKTKPKREAVQLCDLGGQTC